MKNTHHISVRALVFRKDSVLLVRHAHQDRPPFWCFPGGLVEEREDLIAALKRELVEETGIMVEPLSVVAVQEFKREKLLEVIFLCKHTGGETILGSDPDNPGPPVLTDVKWIPCKETSLLDIRPTGLIKPDRRISGVFFGQFYSKFSVPQDDRPQVSL